MVKTTIIKLLYNLLLIASFLLCNCQLSEYKSQRWTEEKANNWLVTNGWLRGCNFIPSTAINQLEMWQAGTFDTATINRELGYAESIGFNVMRVFLHHKAWIQDKAGFINRIDQYLTIASNHNIKTIFVFFDDCWNGTGVIGKQPLPKPGIHNSGWLQDPGQEESADTNYFSVLEKYVKDIMNHFANDDRIVLWDLYNEPGNSNKADTSLNLLKSVFSWARNTKITQPVTSGVWNQTLKNINKFQLKNSDIITYHNYGPDSSMRAVIDTLQAYHRPLLCTEYMARTNGSTFNNILPLLKKENVGAINWGLVKGKTNTIYSWSDKSHTDGSEPEIWFHDIFRPDGTPFSKEEIDLIRIECLNKK
jgi:hypothetical protein